MRKPNLVTQMMNEKIIYGGLVLTRIGVLKWMQEDKCNPCAIDWFVYSTPALPDDTPLTPKSVLDAFKDYLREENGR